MPRGSRRAWRDEAGEPTRGTRRGVTSRGVKPRLAALALLAVALVLAVTSVRRASLTYDEPVHYRYGAQLLEGEAGRFDDSKMPVSALNALPGRLGAVLPAGRWREALVAEEAGRFVTILIYLALAALVYVWSRELYGPAAALLSLWLVVFDPNLMAHGRLVTNDVPLAATVLLACFTFRAWLVHGGRRRAGAAALAFGLAQVAKYTAVYLVPVFLLIALLRSRGRVDVRRLVRSIALFAGATLLVINAAFLFEGTLTPMAGYPWRSDGFRALTGLAGPLSRIPLPLPYPYVEGLDWVLAKERDGVGYIWLLGELRGGKGFFGYFFWVWLLKVPLGTQALLVAALVAYLASERRRRFLDDEVFLLVPAGFFLSYFFLLSQAQWGIRFLLLVFPLLYVFAGGLLAGAAAWPRRARVAVLGTALASAVSVISWYPHYLSYFNEIVWPRETAWRYLADSNLDWGQNQWYLDRWLETHPGVRVEPRAPKAGTIVVGVNKFVGVFNPPRYRWLRENFSPIGHVAYTWLVFEVPADRVPPDSR